MIEAELPDGRVLEFPDNTDPTVIQATVKRVLGVQQQPAPTGARAVGLTELLKQGATFGLSDEVAGAGAATGGAIKSIVNSVASGQMPSWRGIKDAAGDAYDRRTSEVRAGIKDYREKNPVSATAAEVFGGMGTGGVLAKGGASLLNAAKPTYSSMIGRGAAEGAMYGGAYGFGSGEGGLENRVANAAGGATLGGLTGGTVGAVGAKMAQNARSKAVPSADALKTMANAAYKDAENAGVVIGRNRFVDFVDDLSATMKKAGIDADLTPNASKALERLVEAKGTRITLEEAEILRRKLGIPAGNKLSADERRLGSMMKEKFDDFIANLDTADFSLVGGSKDGVAALQSARDLWSRSRKAEMIDDLVERAQTRAGQFSGSGYENALRTEFRALAMNKNRMRGFSEAEQEAIKKVATGGPIDNVLRFIGKLAPRGVVSGGFHLGTAAAFDPVTAGVGMVAGEASRRAATAATVRNAARASEVMRAGRAGVTPLALPPAQQAALSALLMGGSQQGGLLSPSNSPIGLLR